MQKQNQPVKYDRITYENVIKIATGQGDDYATGCILDYAYIKDYYKLIPVDLCKQQALNADPKAVQQINFTANLEMQEMEESFSFLKKQKKLSQTFQKEF